MPLIQPLHTALLVANVDRAEAFYGGVLGLAKVDRPLSYAGAWYQLGDYQIHLIEDSTYTTAPHNTAKWGRNPHIAFGVNDLDAIKSLLVQKGYPMQLSASGRAAVFTQDPDGHVIELSQIA
ncbi:MAG: VOC family protein [Thainema sp.]